MNKYHDVPPRVLNEVLRTLLEKQVKVVTSYQSPKLTVRATRILYGGRLDRRDRQAEIRLTIGPPNFAERRFIRTCQKAGEPFPVRKLQIRQLKTA